MSPWAVARVKQRGSLAVWKQLDKDLKAEDWGCFLAGEALKDLPQILAFLRQARKRGQVYEGQVGAVLLEGS